jgi:imidazolonepropionase-like amidohydrolase
MFRSTLCLTAVAIAPVVRAQAPTLSAGVREYVSVDAPVVALTNVRVIDGTGAPARTGQTIVIRDGMIAAVGDAASTPAPAGARVMDLAGRTVMPGYVMLHEHMFYPSGGGAVYNEQGFSFPRLYLAGGVTTMRTAGNMAGYADFNIKRAIDAGQQVGPDIDATAPYLEGPGFPVAQVKALKDATDARRMVNYWADEGATSFKAYMHITRAELGAAVEEAHKRGLKVTGHLCSVTFREAASLGIDDLEHGFVVATDFVKDKKPDECPNSQQVQSSINALDPESAEAKGLIAELVRRNVAITSTLTVFETFVPGQPSAPAKVLDAMLPEAKRQYETTRAGIMRAQASPWSTLFPKELQLELAFSRAGGLLVVGTDPTGFGGVVAGFSNQRAVELLVDAGFTPVEAIRIATLNGAKYLKRDPRIGSIAAGKQADLIVVNGDPSTKIADVENVELVFKRGVGFDSPKLFASVKGRVGLH